MRASAPRREQMSTVANLRRRTPEPPAGPPEVEFRPGLANETLGELAPLLAEEGPSGLGEQVLPAGSWTGERAATDILALARKAPGVRLAGNPAPPAARQTGVLYGGALALTAAHPDLVRRHRRARPGPDKRRDPLTAGLPFPVI